MRKTSIYTDIVSPLRDNTALPKPASAALAAFGMTPEEIAVYRALLAFGSQPASVLAKEAGFKRGHTYNILARLKEQGIVQEHEKDGVTRFTGCDPASLLSMLERRSMELSRMKSDLVNVIPLLASLRHPLAPAPKVRLFTGVDGIKEIYNDTVRNAEGIIYAFGDFAHFFPKENDPALNDWMWRYCTRRAAKGILYAGIIVKSPDSDIAYAKRRAHKRRLKMLTGVDLPVEVNIYGNRVALISSSRDMVGLIIEDIPIAESLKNLHQAMWGVLPGYR